MTEMTRYPEGVFCWTELLAHDLEAAAAWYAELFGWTSERESIPNAPAYVVFAKQGKRVAGAWQMDAGRKQAGVPQLWCDYISVRSCEAAQEKAQALGATIDIRASEIPGMGTVCFLRDPSGAGFALLEPGARFGAELVNAPGSLSWNELGTRDIEEAERFYGLLFRWTFKRNPDDPSGYVSIELDGQSRAGLLPMLGPEYDGIPPSWTTYFAVADVDASAAKVAQSGGQLHVEPRDIPGVGRFAVVSDPQGGVFTIISLTNPD